MGARQLVTRAYDPWRSRPAAAAFDPYRIEEEMTVETFDLDASLTARPASVTIPLWRAPQAPQVVYFDVKSSAPKAWIEMLLQRVQSAMAIHPNWNSYGGLPTSVTAALQTVVFLAKNLPEGKPMPSIVPTNKGGMQVEWHRINRDLEVRFTGEPAVVICYEDNETGECYDEPPVSPDSPRLLKYLSLVLAANR